MIGTIYKITNPIGQIYIGQTKNLDRRMEAYRTLQCSSQPLIYNSLKKYGFHNHTISIICTPLVENMDKVEIEMINKYKSCYRDNPIQGLNVLKESYEQYIKIKHTLPGYSKGRKTRKVTQYTLWGDAIRTWGSSLDISKITGLVHKELIKALKSKTGYHNQYIWRYV